MALKQQPTTNPSFASHAPSIAQQHPPDQPPLPSPALFDILPHLHELLSRIEHTPAHPDAPSSEDTTDNPDLGALYLNQQPLDPKDLPTAILPLKAQMRKALRECERLPDMERTIAEQEEEIRMLEERIRRQKELMGKLGIGG
jgi:hypothetical protein